MLRRRPKTCAASHKTGARWSSSEERHHRRVDVPAGRRERVHRGGEARLGVTRVDQKRDERLDRGLPQARQGPRDGATHGPAGIVELSDERREAVRSLLRQALDLAHPLGVVLRHERLRTGTAHSSLRFFLRRSLASGDSSSSARWKKALHAWPGPPHRG